MLWIVCASLLILLLYRVFTSSNGVLPGPIFSLPIVGHILELGSDFNTGIRRLQNKYGNVYGLNIGGKKVVVVSDFRLIQEVGNNPAFASRPTSHGLVELRGGMIQLDNELSPPGLLLSNGRVWKEQKRFTLQTLRNLGFGKSSMEQLINEEVSELCQTLKDFEGKPVDVRHLFHLSVVNALWIVMSGQKLSHDNEKVSKLAVLIDTLMQQHGKPMVGLILQHKFLYDFLKTSYFIKPISDANDHEKSFQEDSLKDFTDFYLKEIYDASKRIVKSSFSPEIGQLNMVNTMRELFGAGSDTTSTTLNWAMLFLAQNPEVQVMLHEEMDKVSGRARLISMEDKCKTPYLEAFIQEVQRCSDIAPTSMYREASQATKLGDYVIPEGAVMLQHLGSMHKDPKHFPNPNKFDPSRYLGEDGSFREHQRVVPFGVGTRMCPGKLLAKMSLYLFISGILTNFMVVKEHTNDYLTSLSMPGGLQTPYPYKIKFVVRE